MMVVVEGGGWFLVLSDRQLRHLSLKRQNTGSAICLFSDLLLRITILLDRSMAVLHTSWRLLIVAVKVGFRRARFSGLRR